MTCPNIDLESVCDNRRSDVDKLTLSPDVVQAVVKFGGLQCSALK